MYNINYFTGGRENGTDRDIEDLTGTAVHIMQRMQPGFTAEIKDEDGILYSMERMDERLTIYESIIGTCSVMDNNAYSGNHVLAYEDGTTAEFETWAMAASAAEQYVTYGVRA